MDLHPAVGRGDLDPAPSTPSTENLIGLRTGELPDPDQIPILLAVSDNGAPMTADRTKAFMALCSIAQHFGRPGVPTDQAPIESFFGHIKSDWPHLEFPDPASQCPRITPDSPTPTHDDREHPGPNYSAVS